MKVSDSNVGQAIVFAATDVSRLASNINDQPLELQREYWSQISLMASRREDAVMDRQDEEENGNHEFR